MFAKTIINSDAFLEMPMSARLLYYDLGMRADDDGVVNSPKMIMKMIGASSDDMNVLIARKFVIPFEGSIIVIKHWKINNYIQNDRYKKSKYHELVSTLAIDENGAYTVVEETPCIQDGYNMYTQVRLGKVSIGKDNISIINTLSDSPDEKEKENKINLKNEVYQDIFNYWISMKATIKHRELTDLHKKAIDKAIKRYQIVQIKDAIAHYDLMLRSNYYFNYKWSLEDFLSQSNALPCFTEEGSKWATFMDEVNKNPMLLPKEDRPEERHQAPQCFKDFYNSL